MVAQIANSKQQITNRINVMRLARAIHYTSLCEWNEKKSKNKISILMKKWRQYEIIIYYAISEMETKMFPSKFIFYVYIWYRVGVYVNVLCDVRFLMNLFSLFYTKIDSMFHIGFQCVANSPLFSVSTRKKLLLSYAFFAAMQNAFIERVVSTVVFV